MSKERSIIHLVHHSLLRRDSTFSEIRNTFALEDEELISIIEEINSQNNQIIPVGHNGKGHIIEYDKIEHKIHNFAFPKSGTLKIMLTSDMHLDHTDDRIKYIYEAYDKAECDRVDVVFDLGDKLNGPSRLVHKPLKTRTGTLEGCMDQLVRLHPGNIPTYFITGNHDLKFMIHDGVDIGRLMESECKNLHFLNNLFAPIDFNGLHINISHGSIENVPLENIKLSKHFKFLSTNDPHIICQGHFHQEKHILENTPNLVQVPSLKSGPCSFGNTISNIGVVYLTIHQTGQGFNIEHEVLEFTENKKMVKTATHIDRGKMHF